MQRATSKRSTPTSRAPQTQPTSRWESDHNNLGTDLLYLSSGGQCACQHVTSANLSAAGAHKHKSWSLLLIGSTSLLPCCHHNLYWWYIFSLFSMQLPMWLLRITSRIVGYSEGDSGLNFHANLQLRNECSDFWRKFNKHIVTNKIFIIISIQLKNERKMFWCTTIQGVGKILVKKWAQMS